MFSDIARRVLIADSIFVPYKCGCMICVRLLIVFSSIICWVNCAAQTDAAAKSELQFSEKFLTKIAAKISRVDSKLSKQTFKALQKFERLEEELRRKIVAKDSVKRTLLCSNDKLEQLRNEFIDTSRKAVAGFNGDYNAYTDTLRCTLKFLQQQLSLPGNSRNINDKLQQASDRLRLLEGKLSKAEEIKKYLRERNDFIRQQLQRSGMMSKLKQLEKTGYYYAAYIKEYKDLLCNRKKLEQKAMSLLYATPAFKKFISENSLLAGLFKLPNAGITQAASLAGVQTRSTVQQVMQERIAAGGPNAAQAMRQQVQAAQAELKKVRDKILMYGSADAEIPGFKPNDQKTKTFLHRIEYGMNIQFGSSNNLLPATSDIAFLLGYKLNTNGSIGIGASYKIGLGTGWDNIRFSSQGIGLRSYIDWKLKGKFYLSGGYEQNYNRSFSNIGQLKNYAAWQTSGLLGISKKMQVRGKKNLRFQVMYDFFCYRHVPITQPFVFRTGFSIK